VPFGHSVGPFRQEKNGTYVPGAGTNVPIKAVSCVRGNVRASRGGARGSSVSLSISPSGTAAPRIKKSGNKKKRVERSPPDVSFAGMIEITKLVHFSVAAMNIPHHNVTTGADDCIMAA